MEQKKHAMISYENMPEELAAAFNEKYPKGLSDYLPDVKKIDKPDGTSIYYVTMDIPTAVYLVKVKIKVDDLDDVGKWLDSEDEGDDEGDSDATLPDENISQYSSGDDDDSADA